MSLPAEWVDKIFAKLTLLYGRDFLGRWEGVEIVDVKTDWGHELSGFQDHPDAIAYALKNLPEGKPPTVLQFRALARQVPREEFKALPPMAPSMEVMGKEIARLAQIRANAVKAGEHDGKEWARRILGRYESGESIRPISLRFAREALRIRVEA
jgi:hypothetical protein